MNNTGNWVGVDWGTTNVRYWLLTHDNQLINDNFSSMGMNSVQPSQYEQILIDTLLQWFSLDEPVEVIACGMLGAANGWVEVPYQHTPCEPVLPERLLKVETRHTALDVRIIPGIANYKPNFDVMRGEETQIRGFLHKVPDFEGVLCLPGTHTKWVHVKNSLVVSFQTFLTGELFDLLSKHSVLRHSVDAELENEEEFQTAVDETLSRPELMANRLFSVRAKSLLAQQGKDAATSSLIGTLMGTELAGSKPYWLGQEVAIIGSGKLTKLYQKGLQLTGLDPEVFDSTECTILGLAKTREDANESQSLSL